MPFLEQMDTQLVPSPAQYDVLLPPSYDSSDKTYPLLYWLHGGGGGDGTLETFAERLTSAWSDGILSEVVVVTPHTGMFPNNYLDFPDGTRQWESWIAGELLDHLRTKYRIAQDRTGTFISGISMGGLGCLKIGLKHLDTFAAIIAFEPQLGPTFDKSDGYPDFYTQEFHDKHNPASIVRDNPDTIRNSGIRIYFECGSKDELGFFMGANLLHNTLFENKIHHEYKYVDGGGHVDESFDWRIPDGLAFLERVINPPVKFSRLQNPEDGKKLRENPTQFIKDRWNLVLNS
ncbi:MAG: alpha/beta hydrolase-fold protein [Gammaproteobacteria bacterium]|nr:alpha/beta hydrolase-fold protein [Gammaproteobacteria bacterium]